MPPVQEGLGCGNNDPNGPFYDPMHDMYHLFYQTHVDETVKWGHIASRDMVKWVHLPIAIRNTTWYDCGGVWTGSITLVDGTPTAVYAGNHLAGCMGGPKGFSQAVAVRCSLPWNHFCTCDKCDVGFIGACYEESE